MSTRVTLGVAAAWILSLLLTATWVSAQQRQWAPVEPVTLSGDDVGFRVEWVQDRIPTGTIVVRLNGRWVDAQIGEPPARRIVPQPPPAPAPPR